MTSEFVLGIRRMTDEELLEFFVRKVELRAFVAVSGDVMDMNKYDKYTDEIENIKFELLRRM